LEKYDFHGIFFILAALYFLILVVSYAGLHKVNHHINNRDTIKDLLGKFLSRKNIRKIYYIAFALEFFYALMIIYTPIYLRNLGMSWADIGFAFTVMLIPFVVVEYPIGWLADKKLGEKEMLIFFLVLISITTSLVFFTTSNGVWTWALILLGTRIGAAAIEILRDSYFYKKITTKDVDLIDIYRTANSMAYITASVTSAAILLFAPIRAVFIFAAVVLLSAIVPAARLKDNLSEVERV